MDKVLEYFSGDAMATDAWKDKYQMKDKQGVAIEETPADMHLRMAKEIARIEYGYKLKDDKNSFSITSLSDFGKRLLTKRYTQTEEDITKEIFQYLDRFKKIVPQGSMMSNLGNNFVFGSLSNCFVIASPEDSYGGICRADEELLQLMKRRGGVGTTLDNLRPTLASVTNAARSSSGVPSFAERYSNSTREVAQDGRRGALMLLLSVKHPDIFKFITMKADRTKVTGANISVMFTDEFMKAVEEDTDFLCTFPINAKFPIMQTNDFKGIGRITSVLNPPFHLEYNKLSKWDSTYVMKIHAKELFAEFTKMAHDNAEPGAAYIDRIQNYSPDGVYERFKPTKCNPCGEIWMGDYDACRLIAQNFLDAVNYPFNEEAHIDYERLYETSYMQQRYSDSIVDLEIEYVERIIAKIKDDPENFRTKFRELELWEKVLDTTKSGRRTGNGFTALGDMLAALGLPYSSEAGSLYTIGAVMETKMRAELDATIDMAILRGAFEGWGADLEFHDLSNDEVYEYKGANDFYDMLLNEFPEQAARMNKYGRRNVSWSTVAPTGTVSVMTQTSSGLEPLFKAYYIRRRKVNANDVTMRVDFIDQNGDKWQEYPVLHEQFREWIMKTVWSNESDPDQEAQYYSIINSKQKIEEIFKQSPWFGSEADDIKWEDRVKINAIIQKYTSNSLSCTVNLPADVSIETVHNIYMEAWKKGLKGITIYRDGSRSGVLVTDTGTKLTNCDEFGYTDAIRRPKELQADYYYVTSKGRNYGVVVGLLNNNPYELFAFENPVEQSSLKGKIVKVKKGVYSFISVNTTGNPQDNYVVENLQLSSDYADEKLLTRWVSLLLRHGANPKFIAEQVERSEMQVTSFAKVVARVLKKYIPNEAIVGETCPECQQATIVYQEGCKHCTNCGHSKC